jgi:hypothetical protein
MVKRLATCPSCGGSCEFIYVGSQRWPAEVAARHNLPLVTHLWNCSACETTITEHDLRPYRELVKRSTQTMSEADLPAIFQWQE